MRAPAKAYNEARRSRSELGRKGSERSAMDALSEVLSAIRLDGAVYVNAEFTAPWCVATQCGLHSAAPRLPETDHVVFFHLLTAGSCLARLAGGSEVIEVKAGDLLLRAHDDLHVLGSDLALPFAEVRSAPWKPACWNSGQGEAARPRDSFAAISPATGAPRALCSARCRRCCAFLSPTFHWAVGSGICLISAFGNRTRSGRARSRCWRSFPSLPSPRRCGGTRSRTLRT
jgi:cupin